MLYPDLRRLSIVCPTGMPGTNQAESGGSNDPWPPPASRARPAEGDEAPATAQSEALAKEDILYSILLGLADGDFADVCKAAARWCTLNKTHMAACDDGVWEELTGLVFPGARAPNTGRIGRTDEPTNPKDWFFHLCTQHKQMRDLLARRHEHIKKRNLSTDAAGNEYALLAARYAKEAWRRKQLAHIMTWDFMPPHLPEAMRQKLQRRLNRLDAELLQISTLMQAARRQGARPVMGRLARNLDEEDERILRALFLQQAYLDDINSDPEEQGPPTLHDEIQRRRRLLAKADQDRDLALQAEREEAERKRQERRDLKEQYGAWLAALNQMNPREAALSRLMAEAHDLIRLGIADVRPNVKVEMKRTLGYIERERRARHTFASHPNLMSRLERELARDVDFIKTVMDEAVTVRDLFGSEAEDQE